MAQARAVLARVLDGRIRFEPVDGGYEFVATSKFDLVLAGLVVEPFAPGPLPS